MCVCVCGLVENRIQSYFSTCIGESGQDNFTVCEFHPPLKYLTTMAATISKKLKNRPYPS